MQKLTTLRRVFSQDGLLAAVQLVCTWFGSKALGEYRFHHLVCALTDRCYDWRHGTDTGGVIQLREMGIDDLSGRYYIATPPRILRLALRHIPIDRSRFTFVDMGCGKGRMLLVASELGFRRLIGVDISPALIAVARSNCERGSIAAELCCCDAAEYEFPPGPLVVFMYNPFYADVLQRTLDNLERSINAGPREVYAVYYRGAPVTRELFDASGTLHLCFDSAAIYPWYAIYRTRAGR